MLTAYDWAFVEQAKELRGYCIAQLLEETKHPEAKIRLRAVELLGKVTEVALFTERVEVKKTTMSDHELEQEIKALNTPTVTTASGNAVAPSATKPEVSKK